MCTDRSLGLPNHIVIVNGKYSYIAKYGFAKKVTPKAWWWEYKEASHKTKHGALILNFIRAYLASEACRLEFGNLDRDKVHIYVEAEC